MDDFFGFAVRFFGTEDRPAAKKAEPRSETYPSVKFQLADARDVTAFVKMCDEMVNDDAVIPIEVQCSPPRLPEKSAGIFSFPLYRHI